MNKYIIYIILMGIFLSGCVEYPDDASNVPEYIPTPIIIPMPEQTPEVVVAIPQTEYQAFEEFLFKDNISERQWVWDIRKTYRDQYVCAHFASDLIKSGTKAGYIIYGAALKGSFEPGKYAWHMINVVKLDNVWYFVEPQTDDILSIKDVYDRYKYEYAYIGKEVLIRDSDAVLSEPVRYVDGLVGDEYIYLKR